MTLISLLKTIHITCALISISGFIARVLLKLFSPDTLKQRWLKIAPHAVDTLLLASAIALMVMSRQYPLQQDWLTLKIVLLVFYIGFGMLALRFAQTRCQVILPFSAALLCFFYIVMVALTRQVWPF